MSEAAHPGDLLSALVDGELDSTTAAHVRWHLEACAACAVELDGIRVVRRELRLLPAVEPPVPLLELEARRREREARRARRTTAWQAVAAVALAVALLPGARADVSVGLTGAVDRHVHAASAMSVGAAGALRAPPTTTPHRPVDRLGDGYVAPERLGRYGLVASFRAAGGGVQLLYASGPFGLSLFEQPGSLDDDALPASGRWVRLRAGRAWVSGGRGGRGGLVVVERHGLVVTIVSDLAGDALVAARALPSAGEAPRPRLWERLVRSAADSLDLLSPAG